MPLSPSTAKSMLMTTLTILTAAFLMTPALVHQAQAAKVSITLVAHIQGWNFTTNSNPTLVANQGDRVAVHLTSGDGLVHRFFVDVDETGSIADCHPDKCSKFFGGNLKPATTYGFGVHFAPGPHTYYCEVHPTTMVGSFIVRA